MNLILPLAISLSLFSSGVRAESNQRALVNREGESVCRLADKVNLSPPLTLRVEAESAHKLDECTPRQIFSALAEASPEDIRAAGAIGMPLALGLGAAPLGCLSGAKMNLERDEELSYFQKKLETGGTFTALTSAGIFAWLTAKEVIYYTLSTSPAKRQIRTPYLAALGGLGLGIFGTSYLCSRLNTQKSKE